MPAMPAPRPLRYAFAGYTLDPGRRLLTDPAGEAVPLRAKNFDLLVLLVRRRGEVVGKTEALETLWPGVVVEENSLSQAVTALRQALGDSAKAPVYVATITGRGYQFIAEVQELSGDDGEPAAAETLKRPAGRGLLIPAALAVVAGLVAWGVVQRDGSDPASAGVPIIQAFAEADSRLVTDYGGAHFDPAISADGSMLAFISSASGVEQLWVRSLGSPTPVQLTHGSFRASSPTFSPGSDRIVFARQDDDGVSIYSIAPLGESEPRRVIEGGHDPSFAANADKFVFARGRRLYVTAADGGEPREVDAVPVSPGFAQRRPALSPDGETVAFIHADEGPIGNLWIAPAVGGEARRLTDFSVGDMVVADDPVFSPDGRQLLYSRVRRSISSHLWAVDIESGDERQLSGGVVATQQPAISNGGRHLAFTSVRSEWLLTRVDPSTGERDEPMRSRYPIVLPLVSPDGTTIVFFSTGSDGIHVYTVGVRGENLRQWTFGETGVNTLPLWASDGRSILYYRGRSLHRIHIDEGRDEKVLDDFHWSSRTWLAHSGTRLFFHEFDRSLKFARSAVLDLETGKERDLEATIFAARWSADGERLLGRDMQGGAITICDAGTLGCSAVLHEGEAVTGHRPVWSRDEADIYFLRVPESGSCCKLYSVPSSGGEPDSLVDLPGFDFSNAYFNVDSDGWIVYNAADRSDDEVWLAETGR